MALNPLAKRLYNVAPDPVVLTFADDRSFTFEIDSAEFFQDDFRGEATRPDDDGAAYRITTADDNETMIVGRQGPDEEGWTMFGEVVEVEPA